MPRRDPHLSIPQRDHGTIIKTHSSQAIPITVPLMQQKRILTKSVASFLTLGLLAASTAHAAIAIKTNVDGDLADTITPGLWTGGTGPNESPTSADTPTWDGTSLTGPQVVSTPVTWRDMNFTNAVTAPISLSGAEITLSILGNAVGLVSNAATTISISNNFVISNAGGTFTLGTNTTTNRVSFSSGT